MSYLILARKYRPQKFSDLTGQETTCKILQSAIAQDRVASAYLFSGPRGTGKTTSARIFAKALNCSKPKKSEPCGECSSCEEIAKSTSMDVLELDAASHTGVDNVREVIINTVAYAAARDKYKVFIIDEVHMLSAASFNALLKTIEEPPPHVVFILATTEYHKIPATIASRCQRFRFLPLTQKEIATTLKSISGIEKISVTDEALGLLARAAAGSMRDALSLMDQVISHFPTAGGKNAITLEIVEEKLGVVREDFLIQFLDQVAERNPKGVLEAVGQLLEQGHDLSYFLKEVREAFRQMLIEKSGYKEENSFNLHKKSFPTEKFSLEALLRAGQMLSKCAEQMRWNDFPRMVFECYSVKLCQETLDVSEILQRLENLEKGIPHSAPVPKSTAAPAIKMVEKKYSPPEVQKVELPPAPVQAQEIPAVSASEAPSDFSWRKILARVQQEKPSLYSSLETATASWRAGDVLDLGVPRQFVLDTIKRSLVALDAIVASELKKKFQINLKLVVGQAKAPVRAASSDEDSGSEEDDDTVVVEPLHDTFEAMDQGETFEPIQTIPSAVEDAIEDEGTKKFLTVFHGKVTRLPAGA